jgi:hypothetical protein
MPDTPPAATAAPDQPAEMPDWQERRKAQVKEYGTWVATQPIYAGNALAYDVGHPVPVSNVERHGYDADGLVAKRTSKEGKAALDQAAGV